jgi:hypothetical protein
VQVRRGLRDQRPLDGRDPPTGCQRGDRRPPWNRADDVHGSPQLVSVVVLIALGIAALLTGLSLTRDPAADRWRRAGLAATVAGTAAMIVVWFGWDDQGYSAAPLRAHA